MKKTKKTSGKRSKTQMNQGDWQFLHTIQGKKLPVLTLDPAWHALFVNGNKSSEVKKLERRLTDLLKKQGKLTNDNRTMQGKKKKLMKHIIDNMSDTSQENDKRKVQEGAWIERINEQVLLNEEALGELPDQIKRVNEQLLLETFRVIYGQVEINRERIGILDDRIELLRQELAMKLLEKQEREEYNHNIFNNIKDMIGMEALELYDETHKKK